VCEATQVSLRRTVALRLIPAAHFATPDELARFDDLQRRAAALHHPNLVPYYEVGEWDGGRFIATRFIRGKTLADLRGEGAPPAAESLKPLTGALEAAHAAGLVHGRVSDANVLVEPDGTPYLADLGLRQGGSPATDEQALAGVISRLPAQAAVTRRRTARWMLRLGLLGLAGVGAAAVILAFDGENESEVLRDPPRPLGCRADAGPNTPACTLAQTRLNGRSVTVRRAGVIRGWAVRGASGVLALQVIRERGGKAFVAGFSQTQRLTGPAPQAFPADVGVQPGDRIGVRLSPGAVVGTRSSSRAELVRWDGGLTAVARAPDATLGGELMLRTDIERGARPDSPPQLRGEQAASAAAGQPLAKTSILPSAGRAVRVVLVELPGEIVIDVVRNRRLTRLDVPDADPEGELLGIERSCSPVGAGGFCLRWRNHAEELPLLHAYRLDRSGRIKTIG
jgi:hypothetical protein